MSGSVRQSVSRTVRDSWEPDQSRLCYFRDKNRLPVTPILSSVLRLVRYHLGTVAKGSFIITLVKIPRLVLMYVHNQLKGKVRRRPPARALLLLSDDGIITNQRILCFRRTPVLAAC